MTPMGVQSAPTMTGMPIRYGRTADKHDYITSRVMT